MSESKTKSAIISSSRRTVATAGPPARGLTSILGPLSEVVATLNAVGPVLSDWNNGPRTLELARETDAMLPDRAELIRADSAIHHALREPLQEPMACKLLARLIDGIGRKAPDSIELHLEALLEVVADAGDPTAAHLDLWPTAPQPISPTVLMMTVKMLLAKQVYALTPAELRAALVEAHQKLASNLNVIRYLLHAREQVAKMLALAPAEDIEELPKTPTRAAEREEWISKEDERWPALARRYGRQVPIDSRGGWLFPKSWVDALLWDRSI